MKVFISWSGEKSREVADALREWIPSVLQVVDPFISSKDIRAGTRWQAEVSSRLNDTDFGLICVTRENQAAQWLNFEAGALAKSVESSRVVPIAIDLSPADITNPLGQFQAIRTTMDDITQMLVSMNEVCVPSIGNEHLRRQVAKWWPDLETALEEISNQTHQPLTDPPPHRSDRDLLEEMLETVRNISRTPSPPVHRGDWDRALGDELSDALLRRGVGGWSASIDGSDAFVTLSKSVPDSALEAIQKTMAKHGVKVHFHVEPEKG